MSAHRPDELPTRCPQCFDDRHIRETYRGKPRTYRRGKPEQFTMWAVAYLCGRCLTTVESRVRIYA